MSEASREFDSKMVAMRQTYIKGVGDRCERLSVSVNANHFDEAVRFGHQLKGSGKSYGYPELSNIGSEIESAAEMHQHHRLKCLCIELQNLLARLDGTKDGGNRA